MPQLYYPEAPYCINSGTSISEVIQLLQDTRGLPITLVTDTGRLEGVISNAEVLNFMKSKKFDSDNLKNTPIITIANIHPYSLTINDRCETITKFLMSGLCRSIPIIDSDYIVRKIASNEQPVLTIAGRKVGPGHKPFLVAEIGVNHNGSVAEAKRLIQSAADSGIPAVKFQHRTRTTYDMTGFNSYDLGTQYLITQIDKSSLTFSELKEVIDFARILNLVIIITPFDCRAIKEISKLTPDAVKIASCDLTNYELIKAAIKLEVPLLLSTGMSYEHEILRTHELLSSSLVPYSLLHCTSTYPAPIDDLNLSYIQRLLEITDFPVGYSSHYPSVDILVAAISLGASILEFHITDCKLQGGTDHSSSFSCDELIHLVESCENISTALGSQLPRQPSQGELANRLSLGKSVAYNKNLQPGHYLTVDDLTGVSPATGLPLTEINKLIGLKLCNKVSAWSHVNMSHFSPVKLTHKNNSTEFSFLRSLGYEIGIPVRYHDFNNLASSIELDYVEFHMSGHDLLLEPKTYVNKDKSSPLKLIVHAIEQYPDGFILDLCSENEHIVSESIRRVDSLISHLDHLSEFFKKGVIPVVINIGGYTSDGFCSDLEADRLQNNGLAKLSDLQGKYTNYEFMPQTMPPHPWHQGGRSYHNVLTNSRTLRNFIKVSDFRVCLDISHTALSSYHFQEDLEDSINLLSSRVGHVHLSDARHPGGEGLEIGAGKLDFLGIDKAIRKTKGPISILPEIWHGHLNNGLLFYRSLDRLQTILAQAYKVSS